MPRDRSNADLMRMRSMELDIQKCILDSVKQLTLSAPSGTGLATEVTLGVVSNTLLSLLAENKLDFEMKSVIDANDDVFQLRGTLNEETGAFSWDYIDAAGNVAVPVAPITFLNPDGLLTNILAELQTLNAVDFATAANQALAIAELQTIVTQTTDVATQTTLAALLAAFSGTDFATQTTLASLLATDFATETTLTGAAADLASLLTAFNLEDFATETTLAAFTAAFALTDFATETTLLVTNGLLTIMDAVLDDILTDTTAIAALLTTIDAVLDTIKLDTADIVTATEGIETLLTGVSRTPSLVVAVADGSTTAGVKGMSMWVRGTGATIGGGAVPNGARFSWGGDDNNDTVAALAFTVPTGGAQQIIITYLT